MNPKLTAGLLILAAILANVGFTALGSIFNYPDVLDEPAGDVLASFRDHQGAVSAWFSILALSAALLAPIAIGVGRLSPARAMRIAVRVGIAAAAVQVIGLLRWPILVPGYASDAASGDAAVAAGARDAFSTAERHPRHGHRRDARLSPHRHLDGARHRRARAPLRRALVSWCSASPPRRWSSSASLSPLELPVVDTANFFGYVLWSLWLIAFGVVILVRERRVAAAPSAPSRAAVTS